MSSALHITSGDMSGDSLLKSGLPGDVFVWHDVLYDGPRNPGWPDDATLHARAHYLEDLTGGGLKYSYILPTLKDQYQKLASAGGYSNIVLWFARWLQEQPDPITGLGRLEALALDAIRAGHETPAKIFKAVAAADTPPQYWGDITLWSKINGLAERNPPLVRINGPMERLPQWEGVADLRKFRIRGL